MTKKVSEKLFSYKESDMVDNLERCVCDVLKVTPEQVKSKNYYADVTLARGFIFYMLHKNYGFSIKLISKLYKRCERNVYWHNDKITHFLKQRHYKEIYNNIIDSLK